MFLIICAISLGLLVYYLVLRFSRSGRLLAKIPGYGNGDNFPIIGNTFDFLVSPVQLFQLVRDIGRKNKSITKLFAFHYKYVHVYDPKDAEVILSSHRTSTKDLPYYFIEPWLKEGLLTSTGNKWLHRRKVLTPSFHFNVLKQYFVTFKDHTNQLLDRIKGNHENEETDIYKLISLTTLAVMCEAAMGTPASKIHNEIDQYLGGIEYFGHAFAHRLSRPLLYSNCIYKLLPRASEEIRVAKELHKVTNKIIQDRKASKLDAVGDFDGKYNKKRLGMLDILLDCQKEGTIDDEGIREEVDTFLFEGHDTTAIAQSYMIARLASEPHIQEKIFNELHIIFGDSDRDPETEDLNKMKYLECCIKESLRLYPSVPGVARKLLEDIKLSGYTVPKGTVCYIHMYDMHRNSEVFPDPEAFIPERFTQENIAKRHPYSYIPFSAGPRNCIGQKFAMMEMKTMLSGLFRRYRLAPVTRPNEFVYGTDLVLRSHNPMYVKFIRR